MLRYFIGGLFLLGVLIFLVVIGQSLSPPQGDVRRLAQGPMAAFEFLDAPRPAPEISFVDGEGKELTLADFKGKVLLVNLWATWCGPCKTEMPTLDALQAQMGGEDFQVLAISMDRNGPEVVRQFLKQQALDSLAVYNDRTGRIIGDLATRGNFAVRGLPFTILVDRNSQVVGRLIGPAEWDTREALALMHHFIEN